MNEQQGMGFIGCIMILIMFVLGANYLIKNMFVKYGCKCHETQNE